MPSQTANVIPPLMHFYNIGLLVFFIVGGLLLYRVWLGSWIQAAREPGWLRLLVTCIITGSYLVLTWLWFWAPLFPLAWWNDPLLEWPLVFWIILLFWLILLLIVFVRARRSRYV